MVTIVADTTRDASSGFVDGRIKMTLVRMLIAITTLASVCLTTNSRPPGQIMVEIFTLLAIETLGVVGTLATTVNHVRPLVYTRQRQTTRSMAVTRAGTSHHHVINGVVVLVLDFFPGTNEILKNKLITDTEMRNHKLPVVKKIVTEGVQFGEIDAQIGHFEEILNLLRVRIVNRQVGRQNSEDDFTFG